MMEDWNGWDGGMNEKMLSEKMKSEK